MLCMMHIISKALPAEAVHAQLLNEGLEEPLQVWTVVYVHVHKRAGQNIQMDPCHTPVARETREQIMSPDCTCDIHALDTRRDCTSVPCRTQCWICWTLKWPIGWLFNCITNQPSIIKWVRQSSLKPDSKPNLEPHYIIIINDSRRSSVQSQQ